MDDEQLRAELRENFRSYTYDMFLMNMSVEPEEMQMFTEWVSVVTEHGLDSFEAVRTGAQTTEVDILRKSGDSLRVLNFSSYNYLGLGYEPAVIEAAQQAVATYGLGAASSPVISGTYQVHKDLERGIVEFFGMPGKGVSIFSSGYAVNLGVISAFAKPGSRLVLDSAAHMCILEGAKLSGAKVSYFQHNDMDDLERVLSDVCNDHTRVLICTEGIYSGDGDYGDLAGVVRLAKRYGAYTLVDEAHSVLLAGENGRGVSEMQGVLEQVDFYVMTFSKAFGGVGGAVLAAEPLIQYINWYAKCRMFSCALDPAVTGGMAKAVEIASGPEGQRRRERLVHNAAYLKELLQGKVDLGLSEAWIVTVIFGGDEQTIEINDYLQRQGLDGSTMQFPAVPKNEARVRLFVSSEHTREQLERAARIILDAARKFDFHL